MSGCPFTGAGAAQPLRPELPPLPRQLRKLPTHRGYPVPYFAATVNGEPDFRIADPERLHRAHTRKLCSVCGQPLHPGRAYAFNIGPMCAITRASAEPPNHAECAHWAARACPFLARPSMRRREDYPEGVTDPAGHMLRGNPGVALVWETRTHTLRPDGMGGTLFSVGTPTRVTAYHAGQPATPAQLLAALAAGYPNLHALARTDGDLPELARMLGNAAVALSLDSRDVLAACAQAVHA